MEYKYRKPCAFTYSLIFVAALAAQNCKSVDGIFKSSTKDEQEGRRQYLQITEYNGRVYMQRESGYLLQLKNAAGLENMQANPPPDDRNHKAEFVKKIAINDNTATVRYENGAEFTLVRETHPALSHLTPQLKKGITFIQTQKTTGRQKSFHRFIMQGPFIEATGEKQGNSNCERFTYVLGTGSEFSPSKENDTIGFRATASRHSELGVCGAKLNDGQKYEASDSAFGGVFIFDDDRKVVGVLLLAYMYAEFFIAEGYPPEKAARFMQRKSGTAESVYE